MFTLSLAISFAASCATAGTEAPLQATRSAEWATPMTVAGVPNLHKITGSLYRSAQPTQEGMQNLEKMGIRTVINLRDLHDDKDEVKGTSLRMVDIPMTAWEIRDEKVIAALRQLGKSAEGPYLIHCLHGADRTGVVSAMYRIIYEDWDRQKAIDELRNGGYGFHSVWTNITDYLNNVDIASVRNALSR